MFMTIVRDEALSASFGRLAEMLRRAIAPGLILAFMSLGSLFVIGAALPVAAPAAFFLFHGVFVIALTRRLIHPRLRLLKCLDSRSWAGGLLLTAAIGPFVLLDWSSASYSCADGRVIASSLSAVPALPWFLIGWLTLTLGAVPTRLACWAKGARLLWLPQRILMTVPLASLVLFFGLPFERKTIDCTPPFDGWGLFEGGAILFPLLALFLFSASLSAAALAAAFVTEPGLHEQGT